MSRFCRSWFVICRADATGFSNDRPVSRLIPVKYSPPGPVTDSVGGAVRALRTTGLGNTCPWERLKVSRFPIRSLRLTVRSRLNRNDPRFMSLPMITPSFCSRLPDTK